jgi:transcriptional/translational regulatory protein YebC/TACO1
MSVLPTKLRDFKVLYDFYSMANGTYKKDKILTSTDAYLYVTHKKETTEYKVINRGDIFNPQMYMAQYKDTKTKVLRRYIPFYEESGDLEFVYSNVKLSEEEVSSFTLKTTITLENKLLLG